MKQRGGGFGYAVDQSLASRFVDTHTRSVPPAHGHVEIIDLDDHIAVLALEGTGIIGAIVIDVFRGGPRTCIAAVVALASQWCPSRADDELVQVIAEVAVAIVSPEVIMIVKQPTTPWERSW